MKYLVAALLFFASLPASAQTWQGGVNRAGIAPAPPELTGACGAPLAYYAPAREDFTVTNGNVTRWLDRAGGNDATQASVPPSNIYNGVAGRPIVDFDGSEYLDATSAFSQTELSFYAAVRFDADPAANTINILSTRESNVTGGFAFDTAGTNTLVLRVFTGAGQPVDNAGVTWATGKWYLIEGHIGGGRALAVINGDEGTDSAATMAQSAQAMRIGGKTGSSGGDNLDGQIALLAVFDGVHDSSTRAACRAAINSALGLY